MSKHYPLNRNKTTTTTTSHRCGSTHHQKRHRQCGITHGVQTRCRLLPPHAGHCATSTALHRVLTLPRQPQGTHYTMSRLANQIPSSLLRALLQVRPPKPALLQTSAISQRRVRLDRLPNKTPDSQTVGSPNCAATELCTNKPLWEEANPKRKKIDPSNTLSRALARPHTATVSCSMLGLR